MRGLVIKATKEWKKKSWSDQDRERLRMIYPWGAQSEGRMSDMRRGRVPSWGFQGPRRSVSGPGKQEQGRFDSPDQTFA